MHSLPHSLPRSRPRSRPQSHSLAHSLPSPTHSPPSRPPFTHPPTHPPTHSLNSTLPISTQLSAALHRAPPPGPARPCPAPPRPAAPRHARPRRAAPLHSVPHSCTLSLTRSLAHPTTHSLRPARPPAYARTHSTHCGSGGVCLEMHVGKRGQCGTCDAAIQGHALDPHDSESSAP